MGLKSFWAQPMVLLGVMSLVEARVGPFGGSVCLSVRVHGLRRMYLENGNHFGHTRLYA